MATVRLNKMIKDVVKTRLIKKVFEDGQEKLKKAKARFGNKLYNDVYSLKERKAMEAMPEGFLKTSTSLKVQFQDVFTHVHFDRRPIAAKHDYSCCKVYDAKDPLCLEWVELKRTEDQLEKEKRKAEVDIGVVLDQVTTLKRLLKIWPEVEPWVKDFAEPPVDRTNLPALPISELNKTLGLEKQTS